jgi:hypothetical protein
MEDHATFVQAARSIGLLVAGSAGYRRAIASAAVPGVVVNGAVDRLVTPAALAQVAALQPDWRTSLLPGIGHSPHMEAPGRGRQPGPRLHPQPRGDGTTTGPDGLVRRRWSARDPRGGDHAMTSLAQRLRRHLFFFLLGQSPPTGR